MKKSFAVLIAAAMLLAASLMIAVYAADPGSADDPLVSKSYVDSIISSLKDRIFDLEDSVEMLEDDVEDLEPGAGVPASGPSWTVFQVAAGKKLLGGEGTEIVLRSGTATALDNGADGISDLTSGSDLKTGTAVSKNHLLIVPREDGRGISCASSCWVMVLGDYTIE